MRLLHAVAARVLESARVPAGGRIPGGAINNTGFDLRVPGGTLNYYPAFWIRDAAMMLGGGFVPAREVEGWVRVVAATQPGLAGLQFGPLRVPAFSIPDHITLGGEACWFPGAYTEQGTGAYGFLPPADDAFFFIQMVYEHWRLTRSPSFFQATARTGWGAPRVSEICRRAFESVAADPATGLIHCSANQGESRVDWGFCDAIGKSGLTLMPSLLRWRAANELAELFRADGDRSAERYFAAEAKRVAAAIPAAFYRGSRHGGGKRTGLLLSGTTHGRKDDLWASAFAVWLGVLPREAELRVARHLLEMYESGGSIVEGQVRHLPPSGEFGGHWERASCPADEYQNGGFWATPTGWWITALRRVDRHAADELLLEYAAHLRANGQRGAPWEWINPARQRWVNPLYGSSAGLVYVALLPRR